MNKMSPERFDFICDMLYRKVREVQKLSDEEVGFEITKYNSEKLGLYSALCITIYGDERKYYDICELFNDDAEDAFEKAMEHLNSILSEAISLGGKE